MLFDYIGLTYFSTKAEGLSSNFADALPDAVTLKRYNIFKIYGQNSAITLNAMI